MRENDKEKNKGFTLIEFIIYGVIVTAVVGALVLMSVNVLAARGRIEATGEVSHNARLVLGKIMYDIRRAEQIVSPLPGFSASSLELIDAEGDVRIFSLDATEGNVLQLKVGENGIPFPLTSESIIVSYLQFSNVSYPDTSGTVRIAMTLEFINELQRPEWDFERTFYATENLRR